MTGLLERVVDALTGRKWFDRRESILPTIGKQSDNVVEVAWHRYTLREHVETGERRWKQGTFKGFTTHWLDEYDEYDTMEELCYAIRNGDIGRYE